MVVVILWGIVAFGVLTSLSSLAAATFTTTKTALISIPTPIHPTNLHSGQDTVNPIEEYATTLNRLCSSHGSSGSRRRCLECQKSGVGGNMLCSGGHGKLKRNCRMCHPDLYEDMLRIQRERKYRTNAAIAVATAAGQSVGRRQPSPLFPPLRNKGGDNGKRIMKSISGDIGHSSNQPSSISSTIEESKCVCGNQIDTLGDPICPECAADLEDILRE